MPLFKKVLAQPCLTKVISLHAKYPFLGPSLALLGGSGTGNWERKLPEGKRGCGQMPFFPLFFTSFYDTIIQIQVIRNRRCEAIELEQKKKALNGNGRGWYSHTKSILASMVQAIQVEVGMPYTKPVRVRSSLFFLASIPQLAELDSKGIRSELHQLFERSIRESFQVKYRAASA